jgi:hypothetical protein
MMLDLSGFLLVPLRGPNKTARDQWIDGCHDMNATGFGRNVILKLFESV